MKKVVQILLLVCLQLFIGCGPIVQKNYVDDNTYTIYVSPTGNSRNAGTKNKPLDKIHLAIEKVKTIKQKNKEAKVEVYVMEGEYTLSTPIILTPALKNLKIIGEGSDKVVVKGSKKLNLKWKKGKGAILVSEIKGEIQFDQLFINGKQQILARYPNYNEEGGHWQGHAADAISPERVKSWENPIGAYVHAMHRGEWGGFHYEITKVNTDGTVEVAGGHQNNRPSEMHKKYRMVENVLEELDSPGEWYLDRKNKKLYYWPLEGLDLTNAILEGVELKSLVEIVGTESVPVKNIRISGIKFEHTQRTFMEHYEPLLRSDWTIYRGGALFIEGAENVTIEDCEFTNLGGNVIFVSKYNRNVVIKKNHIHDCGATAVSFVGNPSAVRSPAFQYGKFVTLSDMDKVRGPLNNDYPSKSVVDNNLIYRIGRTEKQVAGVHISMAMDITVSSNSIYDIPRSGINVSEGTWGGHIIEFNDVFNTVLETSDHGAFNSWGRDRFWHPNRSVMNKLTTEDPEMPIWDAIHTTEIRNNRFRCDHGWDIDLDDGSSNYKIYNNVCLNGGLKLREGFYRTVENNIMVNNSFHPHVWFKKSGDIFRRNIVMTKYRDIRLSGWGKEVDYNLFPNKAALTLAQKNNTDAHSVFGDPGFIDSKIGDYEVESNSPAFKIGFKNIPMNKFGVQKVSLKAIAKTPDFPVVWSGSNSKKKESITLNWLGAQLKNIETIEERSASGLNDTSGVLVLEIKKKSVLGNSNLLVGDVIIEAQEEKVAEISDLMKIFQAHNWKGKLNVVIFRNQKPMKLVLELK